MSKPLGISELVSRIGDENIQVQNVAANMTAANNGKKQATITFATSPETCSAMMKMAAGVGNPSIVGLVLWIPANIIDEINDGLREGGTAKEGKESELHDALNECDSYKAAWEKVSAEYAGALKEIRALTDQLDLNRDEFLRIKSIGARHLEVEVFEEIAGLCERSQEVITQRVPVIEQRNRFEKERNEARRERDEAGRAFDQIALHFGFGGGCSPQEIADKLTLP